jgi:hypothetical protein
MTSVIYAIGHNIVILKESDLFYVF